MPTWRTQEDRDSALSWAIESIKKIAGGTGIVLPRRKKQKRRRPELNPDGAKVGKPSEDWSDAT